MKKLLISNLVNSVAVPKVEIKFSEYRYQTIIFVIGLIITPIKDAESISFLSIHCLANLLEEEQYIVYSSQRFNLTDNSLY